MPKRASGRVIWVWLQEFAIISDLPRWYARLFSALVATLLILANTPAAGALPSSTHDYDVTSAAVASTTARAIDSAVRAVSAPSIISGFNYDDSVNLVATNGILRPTMSTVDDIAARGGVGLDGVKVQILDPIADADTIRYLNSQGALARTDSLGIQLHPAAFADEETLLRTLAHERMHVYQIETFPSYGTGQTGAFEGAAYGIEDSFWQYFLGGGG